MTTPGPLGFLSEAAVAHIDRLQAELSFARADNARLVAALAENGPQIQRLIDERNGAQQESAMLLEEYTGASNESALLAAERDQVSGDLIQRSGEILRLRAEVAALLKQVEKMRESFTGKVTE